MSRPPENEGIRLTNAQQRHLAVLFDRLIRETRDRLDAPGLAAIGERDRAALRRALDELLRDAEDAADRLGFRVGVRNGNARRELAAWSSSWWSTVLDARPSALRAYGHVDPEAAEILAPLVDRLADHLYRVVTLSGDAPPADGAAGSGTLPASGQ